MGTPPGLGPRPLRVFGIVDEALRRALHGLPWFLGIQAFTVLPSILFLGLVALDSSLIVASVLAPFEALSAAVPGPVSALLRLLALPILATLNNLLLGTVGMVVVTCTVVRQRDPRASISIGSVAGDARQLATRALALGAILASVTVVAMCAPFAIAWGVHGGLVELGVFARSSERLPVVTVLVAIAAGLLSGALGFRFMVRRALAMAVLAIEDEGAFGALRESARCMAGHAGVGALVCLVLLSIALFFGAVTAALLAWLPGPDDALRAQAMSSLLSQVAFVPSSVVWATGWGAFYDGVAGGHRV
ncbi:MAG: hypothetical protein IPK13_26600 [Deltaproteobacteria bacterium]|nr:hypothetical protein [Deltaproteobacteria bacterium]